MNQFNHFVYLIFIVKIKNMKVCVLGAGLSFNFSKALVNDILCRFVNKKKNNTNSKIENARYFSNVDYFNNNITDIKKIFGK